MSSENKPVMPPERIEETETEEEIRQEEAAKGKGERAFEVFCAAIFLGMIGLVFFNAFLRYVFRSSFAPSEEWARFLFIYITFIGGIEAFYRHKHIAVDMFVNMISGTSRESPALRPSAAACRQNSGTAWYRVGARARSG